MGRLSVDEPQVPRPHDGGASPPLRGGGRRVARGAGAADGRIITASRNVLKVWLRPVGWRSARRRVRAHHPGSRYCAPRAHHPCDGVLVGAGPPFRYESSASRPAVTLWTPPPAMVPFGASCSAQVLPDDKRFASVTVLPDDGAVLGISDGGEGNHEGMIALYGVDGTVIHEHAGDVRGGGDARRPVHHQRRECRDRQSVEVDDKSLLAAGEAGNEDNDIGHTYNVQGGGDARRPAHPRGSLDDVRVWRQRHPRVVLWAMPTSFVMALVALPGNELAAFVRQDRQALQRPTPSARRATVAPSAVRRSRPHYRARAAAIGRCGVPPTA